MLRNGQRLKSLLLVIGDLAMFELALFLALAIRNAEINLNVWAVNVTPFTFVIMLWVVCFYIVGLYNLMLVREPVRLFRTFLEGMIANLAIAAGFFYLLPFFGLTPRTILFLFFSLSLLLVYAWRLLAARLLISYFSSGRILFVGPAEEMRKVDALLRESALNMKLVAVISTSGETYPHNEIPWIPLSDYQNVVIRERITSVVLGVRPESQPELSRHLYNSLFNSVQILDRAEIEEAATGRIPLSYVTESWFLHHLNEGNKAWYESAKRISDVILAIPFGIITILLFPFVAIATKLSSPGPVIYSQLRVGKNGKTFKIFKFRTMHLDAEKNGAQFTTNAKTDPRLFAFGRLMRRLRIDELPQIWNVLVGDLSLIGPRPERPEFVAPLIERMPYYALRHLTRPGLTGWAQVMFLTPTASLEDNLKKLQYDLYYIKHRSFFIDALILLRTVGIVLRRQGT
ncbi:sugar transferase [Candidatus Uhrbacteria bacterium]|nr:sugar transferase [Candidatus Uhrbacteria bacterium]